MATAPRAKAGDGRGDEAVKDVTRQLETLTVGPPPEKTTTRGCRFVYFDLETTGLDRNAHITQIAACSGEHDTFNSFVLPKIPISKKAGEITGIACREGRMYLHGKEVPCFTIREALEKFIEFSEKKKPVVILGHNIKSFDCPILLKALQACDLMERFQNAVHICVDTLPLFRELLKLVKKEEKPKYSLYKRYVGQDFAAHDAREDVQALQQIVAKANLGHDTFDSHGFPFDDIIQRDLLKRAAAAKTATKAADAAKADVATAEDFAAKAGDTAVAGDAAKAAADAAKASWQNLVGEGVVSKYIADKASQGGPSWEEVVHTSEHDREEGVRELLRSQLTRHRSIIDSICQHLHNEKSGIKK